VPLPDFWSKGWSIMDRGFLTGFLLILLALMMVGFPVAATYTGPAPRHSDAEQSTVSTADLASPPMSREISVP
jgi:hypothetical protein